MSIAKLLHSRALSLTFAVSVLIPALALSGCKSSAKDPGQAPGNVAGPVGTPSPTPTLTQTELNARLFDTIADVDNYNFLSRVKACLQDGADVNARNSDGVPFVVAAVNLLDIRILNQEEYQAGAKGTSLLDLLVQHGVQLDATDPQSKTALDQAVELGLTHVADSLIRAGASVTIPDENGNTVVHRAAELGYLGQLSEALKTVKGFDINLANYSDWTPLHKLANRPIGSFSPNLDDLEDVLRHFSPNLEARNKMGETPIMILIASHRVLDVELMLSAGARLDAKDGWSRPALHLMATQFVPVDLANYFYANHVDPNVRDGIGRTALHVVAALCDDFNLQMLLQSGLDGRAVTEDGRSVLDFVPTDPTSMATQKCKDTREAILKWNSLQ